MKIRTGFVSNSSSTSFCIYGTILQESAIRELLGLTDDTYIEEQMNKLLKKYNLEMEAASAEGNDFWIGRRFSSIKDNETGKQFKDHVESSLRKLLVSNIECNHHEDSWYNG